MKMPITLLALLYVALVAGPSTGARAQLTLIQRSIGLDALDWEEGHTELELGDANGDGHLDILSVGDHGNPNVNSTETGVLCYLGDGAGSWEIHEFGNFGYGGLGLGDLNRDGFLDLGWGVHHNYGSGDLGQRLLGAALGDGSGAQWAPWDSGMPSAGEEWGMFATDLADFNGDGLLDMISQSFGGSNGIQAYRNHGDGTWSHAFGMSGGSVNYTIETGDFNADGYIDFAGTRSAGSIYLSDGNFGFTLRQAGITDGIYAVDVGDFDGDGRDDLIIDHGGAGVKAWRLSPDNETWVSYSSGLPAYNAEQVQFGDLNGDGALDVITYLRPEGRCYLGDGAGQWSFAASWTMPSPGDGNALRVDGDCDHDGREDIAVLAEMSGFPFYRNQLRVYSPWEDPESLSVRIVFPDGGEVLRRGSIRKIRWAGAVPAAQGIAMVDLYLSATGPAGPWIPVALDLPNNGAYEWQVMGEISADCYLEARIETNGSLASGRSRFPFSVVENSSAGVPLNPAPAQTSVIRRLQCRPNPAAGRTRFIWSLPAGSAATLFVFNPTGAVVDRRPVDSGRGYMDWTPPARLPAGFYLIELRTDLERARGRWLFLGD
jgi:hypothetical protein